LYRLAIILSFVALNKHINALREQKAAFCAFGAGGSNNSQILKG
jgi:hypothetical protein